MWSEAIGAMAELSKKVFDWATGGRTKSENVLRDEADHWKDEYDKAMAGHDYQHATFALRQLRRVREQARAQRRD
jgi:hypothetical protein